MTLTTTSLTPVDSSSLSMYLQEIRKYPILSAEEEYLLARQVIDQQNIQAAHKLVTSHLKLVVKIALSMRGYGIALMDLIAEGNIGLMHAVKKFDPELGHRLSTYAMWWIKAAIQEYVIKSWSLVKIGTTVAQKKLFFNLKKAKQRILNFHSRNSEELSNDDISELAVQLNVTENEIKEMDSRLSGGDYSLDNPVASRDGMENATMLDFIPESRANQEIAMAHTEETNIKKRIFGEALANLSERERAIVAARHMQEEPETLDVLSKQYNISRERIRQIETAAMNKLKSYVKQATLAIG